LTILDQAMHRSIRMLHWVQPVKLKHIKKKSPGWGFTNDLKKTIMLDQLIKLVEQNAGTAIVQNKAIPDQQNQAAINIVAEQIFDGLKSQAAGGNIQQLASMFQSGSVTNNPIVTQLVNNVASQVASKLGISNQAAQSMASSLLPTVMNQLVQKTNDPNDSSFDLGGVMSSVTGKSNFDIGSLLQGKTSGDIGGMLGGLFGR